MIVCLPSIVTCLFKEIFGSSGGPPHPADTGEGIIYTGEITTAQLEAQSRLGRNERPAGLSPIKDAVGLGSIGRGGGAVGAGRRLGRVPSCWLATAAPAAEGEGTAALPGARERAIRKTKSASRR